MGKLIRCAIPCDDRVFGWILRDANEQAETKKKARGERNGWNSDGTRTGWEMGLVGGGWVFAGAAILESEESFLRG